MDCAFVPHFQVHLIHVFFLNGLSFPTLHLYGMHSPTWELLAFPLPGKHATYLPINTLFNYMCNLLHLYSETAHEYAITSDKDVKEPVKVHGRDDLSGNATILELVWAVDVIMNNSTPIVLPHPKQRQHSEIIGNLCSIKVLDHSDFPNLSKLLSLTNSLWCAACTALSDFMSDLLARTAV